MPVEKRIHIEKFFYCFRKLISCVFTNRLMCCIFAIINGCVHILYVYLDIVVHCCVIILMI